MADCNCLDTNAALRLLLKDVPKQHLAVVRLVSDRQRDFYIPDLVFFEINFTLMKGYGFEKSKVVEFLRSLVALPNIKYNSDIIAPALAQYEQSPKLSLADCYLAEYARANRMEPLWTFDRKLARQSGAAKEIK
jgi:predicted nucleic acid-binding protein